MELIVLKAGLIITTFFLAAGTLQWTRDFGRSAGRGVLLDYAGRMLVLETRKREEEERLREEEARKQKSRIFGLDFMISHGTAFGGISAICQDGRRRRGSVPVSEIPLYGRHPSGGDFSYFIEDEDLEICACDLADELVLKSDARPFVVRESGMGRDQGMETMRAVLKNNIIYHVILESKHEITVCAAAKC